MIHLFASLLVALVVALPAHAKDTRMDRLKNSNLISALKSEGPWKVTFAPTAVIYVCRACSTIMTAGIFVRQENIGPKDILNRRKAQCAKLATDGKGRCVRTNTVSQRGGAFAGFRFETERGGATFIHLVFPYNETGHAPESITGTLSYATGADIEQNMEQVLLAHMRRLTIWW